MKIVSHTYCEGTQENNGQTIIIAPLQMITLPFLPTSFSVCLSIGIFDVNPNGFKIEVSFVDPDNTPIQNMSLTIPAFPNVQNNNKDTKYGIQLNLGLQNISFTKVGEYKTVVSFEDGESSEFPIEVIYNEQ